MNLELSGMNAINMMVYSEIELIEATEKIELLLSVQYVRLLNCTLELRFRTRMPPLD